MIPLKDDNPTATTPIVTIGIIIINVIVHLYHMTLSAQGSQMFTYQFGLIPVELTNLSDMTPQIPFPVLLSPFSSMFIHGDLMHLGGNMLYLWIFGNNIEDHLGRGRFFIFYILSGLAAVGLFILFNPHGEIPLIGASGAIAGVLGAYMILYPRARILTLIWIIFIIRLIWLPAIFILGYWIVIQFIMAASDLGGGSEGGVAWFAHIGGFAFGWLLFRLRYKKKRPDRNNNFFDRRH